ncbi:MAG: ABC transporter ATP-binding protein [Anaerolineae bacterium]
MLTIRMYGEVLWQYMRPLWRKAALLTVVLFGSIGLQLLNPQIVRGFIDAAQAQAAPEKLILAAFSFLGVGLTVQTLNVVATYVGTDLGFGATNALRADLAEHCLRLDMAFHNDHTPGEFIERIDGDVTALSNFFSQFAVRLLGSALLMAGVLAMLYREDWRVGLALTVYVAVSLAVLHRMRAVAVDESTEERQASADLFGFLEERVAGLDDIRANGAGAYTMLRLYQLMRVFYHTGRLAWRGRTRVWRTMMALFGLGQVLALGIGAYLYTTQGITIGTVFLLYNYTRLLADPLEHVAHQIQDLQKAAAGIGRVRELLAAQPAIRDGAQRGPAEGALALSFENVHFGYGEAEPVLHDVSFHLAPGSVLGLLGRTGSGKTTLTRLLFRLYDPMSGTIRLGEQRLDGLRLGALRERVAMVTQDVQLFRASVRDNLSFFDSNVSDERQVQVLRELGLGEWYDRLPQGLDTVLDADAASLSAGEAQLLAFARAFLKDPGLIVLDEPSSRLDPASERLLQRAMDRLLAGRTGIIIAHRLSTVQRVDEIMIMEDGGVREYGRRDVLAADTGSRFHELLTTSLEEALA